MADKQLAALTAASALSTGDLFYVSQGGNSRKATGTQIQTLARAYRGCLVNKASNQTGANYSGAGAVITFDQEQFDTDNIHSKASTVTITIASPGVVSWTAHGLIDGCPIVFSTTGALPTGLTAGTTYFVKSPATDTFNVAATAGGAAINTSGTQSGVQTATVANYVLVVPAGVSKVRLSYNLRLSSISAGAMQTFVQKNGAFTYVGTFGSSYDMGASAPLTGNTGPVLAVTAGDFFNVFLVTADVSLDVSSTSYFSMDIIE